MFLHCGCMRRVLYKFQMYHCSLAREFCDAAGHDVVERLAQVWFSSRDLAIDASNLIAVAVSLHNV